MIITLGDVYGITYILFGIIGSILCYKTGK